ncbi:uncharacterized protein B0I36DRAFT_127118 [Microdochium trichocladiopsis]|uniref:Uncharacterized protein n=1 Tax=Microdochium trichocladiopsis TaxID=1682393 RepID=A0A9P8Y411_9PEZI|nr:uncharacterized protein B0I36DRAFT_127118 [Microdochium trichocladiopsis]KAH7028955.1 hypothetical protein B0I36DRAFT_127118 [Microdochium trichocladiopsis]
MLPLRRIATERSGPGPAGWQVGRCNHNHLEFAPLLPAQHLDITLLRCAALILFAAIVATCLLKVALGLCSCFNRLTIFENVFQSQCIVGEDGSGLARLEPAPSRHTCHESATLCRYQAPITTAKYSKCEPAAARCIVAAVVTEQGTPRARIFVLGGLDHASSIGGLVEAS